MRSGNTQHNSRLPHSSATITEKVVNALGLDLKKILAKANINDLQWLFWKRWGRPEKWEHLVKISSILGMPFDFLNGALKNEVTDSLINFILYMRGPENRFQPHVVKIYFRDFYNLIAQSQHRNLNPDHAGQNFNQTIENSYDVIDVLHDTDLPLPRSETLW